MMIMEHDRPYRNKAWLENKYTTQKLSAYKIAEIVGVNHKTIWYWLHKHGVCMRSIGEANKHRQYTKETRQKIGNASRGRIPSAEARQKMSDAHKGEKSYNYGKHHSTKTKQKMSDAHRGKHHSEETRKKMSKAHSGENNTFYGKTHSEEARLKNSIAHKGRAVSEETKQKISNSLKGNKRARGADSPLYGTKHPEHSDRMKGSKNPFYGKKHSAETREKLRAYMIDSKGEKNPSWRGGVSFEPYCHKFNYQKKEEIRDKYDRTCFICGAEEDGQKLCVHHTSYNKMDGCETQNWNLVPLCRSCYAKTNGNRWHWFGLLYNHWAMDVDINFQSAELV